MTNANDVATGIATILAVAGVSKSIEIGAQTLSDITKESFSLLLKPVFGEAGLALQDCAQEWRQNKARRIAEKADALPREHGTRYNPLIAFKVLEAGSSTDDELLQNMWAGLLASSCTESGDDDSNLIYINLIANMTRRQAKIIDWLATIDSRGSTLRKSIFLEMSQLGEGIQETDLNGLKSEFLHLFKTHGLLDVQPVSSGGIIQSYRTQLSETGLNLYIRCQGSRVSPEEFFSTSEVEITVGPERFMA